MRVLGGPEQGHPDRVLGREGPAMLVVALLLLPVLSLLLYGLDRVEDHWVTRPPGPRHARRRPPVGRH